ncbi:MAG TPA: SGNH/GDSL hydrolase family protein, partial [Fodinibius sp.]|nr:SGNH/GDSL hydrolase family protein [Fodinibius sp.]
QLYQACMQALVQTEADAAIFNIPDVTSIPFVFFLRARLQQQEALTFDQNTQTYQLVTPPGNFPVFIETAGGTRMMRQNDFLLLSASDYVAGVQSGEIPPPISPDNPVPNQLVLDGPAPSLPSGSSELAKARGAVQQYNNIIASAAENNGYALVDIHSRFNEIIEQGGIETSGDTLRPVPGELFSFDGVHPGNRGSGVIANQAIEAINNTFNANLPAIDLATIPRGIPVAN